MLLMTKVVVSTWRHSSNVCTHAQLQWVHLPNLPMIVDVEGKKNLGHLPNLVETQDKISLLTLQQANQGCRLLVSPQNAFQLWKHHN